MYSFSTSSPFLSFRGTVPPNIAGESTPQDVSVLLNRQVTLECKSDAVPPPTLTWLKDGQPLQVANRTSDQSNDHNVITSPNLLKLPFKFFFAQASARVRLLSSGRYLQINLAELDDKAQYTCVASNVAGKTTRQFNLAVNGKVSYYICIMYM